jgi:methylthioribose-1-phosphate isomerase
MADIRPVGWDDGEACVVVLDQTRLPGERTSVACRTVDELVDAIERLVVRGAPALGVAGAYGVALALVEASREGWDEQELNRSIDLVRDARPTAVNLARGVDLARAHVPAGLQAVLAEAHRIAADDEAANRELSRLGADWILARVERRPLTVLTHCNAGALATSAWGTALGLVRELHQRGVLASVFVDETRPLLQGSRLTAWELEQEGISYVVQADAAAASTIARGLVDVAVVGADRIARNGDAANKIGTLGVALACRDAGIPFVVAAPATTVDPGTAHGDEIPIELRSEDEVLSFAGARVTPVEARGFNPAFDVTPHRLVDAIVTEHAVVEPDGTDVVARLTGAASPRAPHS